MNLSQNNKKIILIIAIILVVGVGGTLITLKLLSSEPEITENYLYPDMMGTESEYSVKVTYIEHAGIMLETEDLRIYVDPYHLDDSYMEKPADIVFITHHHTDHYDTNSLAKIVNPNTKIITPKSCTIITSSYNATGVEPRDNGSIEGVEYEAFYMYNIENFNHPENANWCSFIITVENITFFHAGDSDNITEYSELTDRIDVAFLPIGGSTYTMDFDMAINAVSVIQPKIFVPIHHWGKDYTQFVLDCEEMNPNTDVIVGPIFYLK